MASFISTLLFGIRNILNEGDPLPQRPTLDLYGMTVEDDPVNNSTKLTVSGLDTLTDATSAATPNTLVKRNGGAAAAFGGTCQFVSASFSGTLGLTGAATLSSTLAVTGATTITGLLTANGGIAVSTVDAAGDVDIQGNLTGGDAAFSQDVLANSFISEAVTTKALSIDSAANVHKLTLSFDAPGNAGVVKSVQGAGLFVNTEAQTTPSTPSKVMVIQTGNTTGSTSNSGDLGLLTGSVVSGNSGTLLIASGNSSNGVSGTVIAYSGDTNGSAHASGSVRLASGATSGSTSPSGTNSILTGNTQAVNAPSGAVVCKSGDTFGGSGSSSGAVSLQAGDTTGTSCNGGTISILGGNATGATAHGSDILVKGGNSAGSLSPGGNVDIIAGNSSSSFGGSIGISRGTSVNGGNIYLHAPASTGVTTTHGKGNVYLANTIQAPSSVSGGGVLYMQAGNLWCLNTAGVAKQMTV